MEGRIIIVFSAFRKEDILQFTINYIISHNFHINILINLQKFFIIKFDVLYFELQHITYDNDIFISDFT